MHESYEAVYKLVYIFLYESKIYMHPMKPYINLYTYFLI